MESSRPRKRARVSRERSRSREGRRESARLRKRRCVGTEAILRDEANATSTKTTFLTLPVELRLQIYDYCITDLTTCAAQRHKRLGTERKKERKDDVVDGAFRDMVEVVGEGKREDWLSCYGGLISEETVYYRRNEGRSLARMLRECANDLETWRRGGEEENGEEEEEEEEEGKEEEGKEEEVSEDETNTGPSIQPTDSGYYSVTSSITSTAAASATKVSHPVIPILALVQTSSQIRHEVLSHLRHPTAPKTTLYTNYPYGLMFLQDTYPGLASYMNHVHISGYYDPEDTYLRPRSPFPAIPAHFHEMGTAALNHVLQTIFPKPLTKTNLTVQQPKKTSVQNQTLEFRLFVPSIDRYDAVWGVESPASIVLAGIPRGEIDMAIYRGNQGTGVVIKTSPILNPPASTSTTFHARARDSTSQSSSADASSSTSHQTTRSSNTDTNTEQPAQYCSITGIRISTQPSNTINQGQRRVTTRWKKFKGLACRDGTLVTMGNDEATMWRSFGEEEMLERAAGEERSWVF